MVMYEEIDSSTVLLTKSDTSVVKVITVALVVITFLSTITSRLMFLKKGSDRADSTGDNILRGIRVGVQWTLRNHCQVVAGSLAQFVT